MRVKRGAGPHGIGSRVRSANDVFGLCEPSDRKQKLGGGDRTTERRERERPIFFRGYNYTLRDQDTTWPAAYKSVRRGHDEKGFIYWAWVANELVYQSTQQKPEISRATISEWICQNMASKNPIGVPHDLNERDARSSAKIQRLLVGDESSNEPQVRYALLSTTRLPGTEISR